MIQYHSKMSSHNSKYYTKRLKTGDAKSSRKILDFFKTKQNESIASTSEASETVSTEAKCDDDKPEHQVKSIPAKCDDHDKLEHLAVEKDYSYSSDHENYESNDSSSGDEEASDYKKLVPDQRLFSSDKYEISYPWLYWSCANNGYICKYCELFATDTKKKSFVSEGVHLGTHPTRKLKKHSDSSRHVEAEKKYVKTKSADFSKNKQSNVYELLARSGKSENERESERLRNRSVIGKFFQICYFIVRKKWAQANFEDFVKFVADLGVQDIADHLQVASSDAHYTSSTTVTEMINIIGDYIERKILTSIRDCSFYSLLMDESTDEANREQLSVYARFEDRTSVDDHYLGLVNVDRTDSESLLRATEQFLNAKQIDIQRCRFVAFDGTNTMSGEVSGLQRRIRHLSPKCLYVNCRNHRLALCLKHLMKTYQLLADVDAALLSVWKLFHYSPKRFAIFKNMQETYGQEPLTLVRAATTRWLSHGKACIRFIDRYEQVIDTLDAIYTEKKEPEVYGLRLILTRKPVVAMVLLLCDVLKPINILSLYLQNPHINFTSVESKIKLTMDELTDLVELLPQLDGTTYFSKVTDLFDEIDDRTALQMRLRLNNQDINLQPQAFLQTTGIPFIYSLIGEITDAFHNSPVLKSYTALDPRNFPDDVADLSEHAREDFNHLIQHYGNPSQDTFRGHVTYSNADINLQQTQAEFDGFKRQLFMMRKDHYGQLLT